MRAHPARTNSEYKVIKADVCMFEYIPDVGYKCRYIHTFTRRVLL